MPALGTRLTSSATVWSRRLIWDESRAFRDPENRSIQVSLVSGDAVAPEDSVMSVGVADVDAAYARARELGYQIVYPLTHEPWGVPRFFVRDPHGHVVNIVGHLD